MNKYQIAREVIEETVKELTKEGRFQWRDGQVYAEEILEYIDQQQAEPVCICCFRVEDYMVTPNPDCPLHGGLHGKNPYEEQQAEPVRYTVCGHCGRLKWLQAEGGSDG